MTRVALAIGCGGTIGGAWSVAALHALAEQLDWDPRQAQVLQGTSAGAELVTLLAGGYSTADLVDMQSGRSTDALLAAHLATPPGSTGWPVRWQTRRPAGPDVEGSGWWPTGPPTIGASPSPDPGSRPRASRRRVRRRR
ncbi:hypothetical protein GOHSU_16_00140 [Gordonia hirsuta DSM 44140 = NBRC 16056]|uniref:PNPLA domain-containing protein n=1 Tax=Gordonia hirsuta DSM 44140 = NBRC 16056 TaxID=1121927 RepID=L7LAH8_9ACTN|nr:hypothetical protein GOHSU_16_00140 [Gordonia hirsuta DSM 44140 = NBRC 16056]